MTDTVGMDVGEGAKQLVHIQLDMRGGEREREGGRERGGERKRGRGRERGGERKRERERERG